MAEESITGVLECGVRHVLHFNPLTCGTGEKLSLGNKLKDV